MTDERPVERKTKVRTYKVAQNLIPRADTDTFYWSACVVDEVLEIICECNVEPMPDNFGEHFDHPSLRIGGIESADAVLFQKNESEPVQIRVFNAPKGKQIWTVPQFYAAVVRGKTIEKLRDVAEETLWRIRAFVECIPVWYDPPFPVRRPRETRESVQKAFEGFVLLAKVRFKYDHSQLDNPFAQRFGMPWCGIGNPGTFGKAIHWLVDNRFLEESRREPSKFGRGKELIYYRFGPAALPPPIPKMEAAGDFVGLLRLTGDEEESISTYAAGVFIRLGEKAIPALEECMRSDESGLCQIALQELALVMFGSEGRWARRQLYEVMGIVQTDRGIREASVPATDRKLLHEVMGFLEDADPGVRAAAILATDALTTSSYDYGVDIQDLSRVFRRAAGDADAHVRSNAIAALGTRMSEEEASLIFEAVKDIDARVRRAALWSLSMGQGINVTLAIINALEDSDAGVREMAAGCLADCLEHKDILRVLQDRKAIEEDQAVLKAIRRAIREKVVITREYVRKEKEEDWELLDDWE